MRLVRHGAPGSEGPGLIDAEGVMRDLSAHLPDLSPGTVDLATLDRLRAIDPATLPPVPEGTRIGPVLSRVATFHCIGINYRLHAEEAGTAVPNEPIVFTKAASALSGPCDPVPRPRGSDKLDYEVELGVVIGAPLEYASETEAMAAVAGYCVVNDVSERTFQMDRAGQWVKGKSARGFGPCGPWLVTPDEVPDPQALGLWLSVNGEVRQRSTTADMIFPVAEILACLSRYMVLVPGDIVATGTPSGVAMGMRPHGWLRPGDEIRLGIDRLGEQCQTVTEAP